MKISVDVCFRALSRFYFEAPTGCHISTYSVASHGYAQIGWNSEQGRTGTTAHRAAWTAIHGPIPEGMTIDHLCKRRRCVNVQHLRMLGNYENARRTAGRDWPLGQCANGHPDSELRQDTSGRWRCGPCARASAQKYNRRRTPADHRRSNQQRRVA